MIATKEISQSTWINLSQAHIFHFTGKDCSRYLHARLSNNVRDLRALQGCAAAALSPQGRTEVFATVIKITAEEYYVICDGGEREEVQKSLLRYKVADRVDCLALLDYALLHIISPDLSQVKSITNRFADYAAEFAAQIDDQVLSFKHRRAPDTGIDLLAPRTRIAEILNELTKLGFRELGEEQQRLLRIAAQRPAFPSELNDQAIFLESGLTHAVSFTKGCYVGQEVIEKVDSHGRLPFSLVSIISAFATTPPNQGDSVILEGKSDTSIGEVISSARDTVSGRSLCFARLKTGVLSPESNFQIADQEYRRL